MPTEKFYTAKQIKIALMPDSKDIYYIDLLDSKGYWEIIATGDLEYIKSFINKIVFL